MDKILYTKIKDYLQIYFENIQNIEPLTGGIINTMFKFTGDNNAYVIRIFPESFQEKLKIETEILQKAQINHIKAPKIIKIDNSRRHFQTPVLILEWIEGSTLKDEITFLTNHEFINILEDVDDQLIKLSNIYTVEQLGYLHESNNEIISHNINNYLKESLENYIKIAFDAKYLSLASSEKYISHFNHLLDQFEKIEANIAYPDLCLENIIVHNKKLAGIIDWEFIMGLNFNIAYGNLILKSCLIPEEWIQIKEYLETLSEHRKKLIVMFSIFRGFELISYLPNTTLYSNQISINNKCSEYINSLNYILSYSKNV